MRSKRVVVSGFLLWVAMACVGCATKPSPSFDYSEYRAHMPRSILVLPPLNESVEVDAPYSYLTTLSRPVAERGYYVFPVSMVDAFMKDNGLPTAGEMHGVSLSRIEELIGADAILYLTIADWGQKYQVLNSQTVVSVEGRLVDVASGTTLWTGDEKVVRDSNSSDDLAAMLIGAIVSQVVGTALDRTRPLAQHANWRMFFDESDGLLVGPRHPKFGVAGGD